MQIIAFLLALILSLALASPVAKGPPPKCDPELGCIEVANTTPSTEPTTITEP